MPKSLNIIDNGANKKVTRRDFLKVLGAGASVGLTACADSAKQKVFPLVKGDANANPGVAFWYKSTCKECEAGCGTVIRVREGRAVKIEGNPEHPINKGGLCALGQSALQGLYDPDRIREPLEKVTNDKGVDYFQPISWDQALNKLATALKGTGSKYFIRGEETGTLKNLFTEFSKNFELKEIVWDQKSETELAEAANKVFGIYGIPYYDFSKANLILSLGADYLENWISPVEFAHSWSKAKNAKKPVKTYQVEPRLSLTGARADFWYKSNPGSEAEIVKLIISELLKQGKGSNLSADVLSNLRTIVQDSNYAETENKSGISKTKLEKLVQDLVSVKSSLVVAGGTVASNSDQLLILTNFLNLVLGNVGSTVTLGSLRKPESNLAKILEASKELNSKNAELAIVHKTDPVYNLPTEVGFRYAFKKAKLKVALASHFNDTVKLANLILPIHTTLESWSDASPRDGIYSLTQPSMKAVFNTKELGDIIIESSKLAGKTLSDNNFEQYLKASWELKAKDLQQTNFASFWNESLKLGGYFDSEVLKAQVKITVSKAAYETTEKTLDVNPDKQDYDLTLYPFATIKDLDGGASNRSWLQELPDTINKLVWSDWAEMHPDTAKRLGFVHGDTISIDNYYGEMQLPLYVTNYVAKDLVAVPISGSKNLGRYAKQAGNNNVFAMLTSKYKEERKLRLLSTKVRARRSRISRTLVETQGSNSQMGRDIAAVEYIGDHHKKHHHDHPAPKQMYEQRTSAIYDWGMAIDLASCTGCSACVVACYAENNIPTVGREICYQGREMSWLRIERYYDGNENDPQAKFIPMLCQHCGNAPCEPVCPVYATYHNEDGLNAMVYNRCVGTRYCGNNCSYKVRRFNWFEYDYPEPLDWQLNPDVMKRTAGVMEKCTFCVQRIVDAKDHAKDEGRLVADGEIQPACAQSCPTKAITFGNRKDITSKVSKLARSARAYKVLDHHINTQPAISYLKDRRYKV